MQAPSQETAASELPPDNRIRLENLVSFMVPALSGRSPKACNCIVMGLKGRIRVLFLLGI